jgi:outer membrane lipoprotein-sorting protein
LHRAVILLSHQGALQRASIMDLAGGRVDYVLGDVKATPKLANSVFDFKIPEGVEVQRVKF